MVVEVAHSFDCPPHFGSARFRSVLIVRDELRLGVQAVEDVYPVKTEVVVVEVLDKLNEQ